MSPEVFDPFTALPSDRLLELLFRSPSVESLLQSAVAEVDLSAAARGEIAGTMTFAHYGLRGPPNRLHGGLHLVARTLLVAAQLGRAWPEAQLFPCATWVRIGAPIPLRTEVAFEGRFGEPSDGRRYLVTRFDGSARLEGAMWSAHAPLTSTAALAARWRSFHRELEAEPGSCSRTERIGIRYTHHPRMTVARFEPSELARTPNPWQRFRRVSGGFSIALASYQLDNVAAASRMADLDHPCFTTRLALWLARAELPDDGPLLFCVDRAGRVPAPHARARPVVVHGRAEGTHTAEVVLASEGFREVYAHGWVDTHPM